LEGDLALGAASGHHAQPRRRVYTPVASCGFSGWCIWAPRPVESGSPFRSKIPRHPSVASAS